MQISKRGLCQMWAESVDCNLAANWLFDRYEMDAAMEQFAEGLPESGLPIIREEIEARLEMRQAGLKAHNTAMLADEPAAKLKALRYELLLNAAGLERAEYFMGRAQKHIDKKCRHFTSKSEYIIPGEKTYADANAD